MNVQGRCHCGAITYEAEVQPGTVNICHCRDCQMLTGSAFRANIQAPAQSFRILTGKPREYVKTADSGARRVHAFCANCGAPVYSCATENPQSYSLRLGACRGCRSWRGCRRSKANPSRPGVDFGQSRSTRK